MRPAKSLEPQQTDNYTVYCLIYKESVVADCLTIRHRRARSPT